MVIPIGLLSVIDLFWERKNEYDRHLIGCFKNSLTRATFQYEKNLEFSARSRTRLLEIFVRKKIRLLHQSQLDELSVSLEDESSSMSIVFLT